MKFLSLPYALPRFVPFENRAYGYPCSNILSTSGGIISNYYFSILFVFKRGKHSKKRELTYFMILSVITMLMSWMLFALFHSFIHHPVDLIVITVGDIVFCKAVAIFLVSLINYVVKRKFIFSR